MTHTLLWLLCIGAAWDLLGQVTRVQAAFEDSVLWRRRILAAPARSFRLYCAEKDSATKIYWRQNQSWNSICEVAQGPGTLPRYWLIQTRSKYEMLFLVELPITVSIVILR